MMTDQYRDVIVNFFNEARVEAGLPEVANSLNASVSSVAFQSLRSPGFGNIAGEADLTDKLQYLLDSNVKMQNYALSKDFTHINADFSSLDSSEEEPGHSVDIELTFYSRFLEIEGPGHLIEGDLVIQGSTVVPDLGPALCIVDHIIDIEGHNEVKERVAVIKPWDMITMPLESDSSLLSFHIPIQLSQEFKDSQGGFVRVRIYVDQISKIPYSEEQPEYPDNGEGLVCAIDVNVLSSSEHKHSGNGDAIVEEGDLQISSVVEGEEEGGIAALNILDSPVHASHDGTDISNAGDHHHHHHHHKKISHFVKDIKIALDYDEMSQLRSEGYDCNCVHFLPDSGLQDDNEQRWSFHIMHNYDQYDDNNLGTGIEDIVWHRCEKNMGTIPAVSGFEVHHENDLTSPECDFSVFLCTKKTDSPRFKSLRLITCDLDHEHQMRSYIETSRFVFKQAPLEICTLCGGLAGLLLEPMDEPQELGPDGMPIGSDSPFKPESPSSLSRRSRDGGDRSGGPSTPKNVTVGEEGFGETLSDDGDDCSDYDDNDIEEEIARNEKALQNLFAERDAYSHQNLDLQQRAALLIAREKMMQGQNTTAKSAQEAAQQAVNDALNFPEVQAEKEKQFREGLQVIVEDGKKLSRQKGEFDHLANDLQTRLDDKEYKATEITESFRKFKREILQKAVNSRTALPISKVEITTLESNEQKRDEDLEKVRLRNISLRTTLKKIEKALRAREQLAEGLHMIDFEQLKIENQTLNEKIEERNEELTKLKRKKQITVQILTHVREKIRFYDKCNTKLKEQVYGVETNINGLRGTLSVSKHDRDVVKRDIKELKRQQGFATSDLLIVDYENRKSELETARVAVKELHQKYKILVGVVESQPRQPLISLHPSNPNNYASNVMPPKPKI